MDVGFMDPYRINHVTVKGWEMETFDHVFRFLDKHHDKGSILLPYNFR